MATELITIEQKMVTPKYSFKGIADIANLRFTNSSPGYLTVPDAVKWAAGKNGQVLQSAAEASAFRYAALDSGNDGLDGCNDYQITRTPAIYFKSDEIWHVAFDDINDPSKNIILAKAGKGYKSHKAIGKFPLSIRSKIVKEALRRAEKADRIIPVNEENPRYTSTKGGKDSEAAQDKGIRAILTYAAPMQAAFIEAKGYSKQRQYTLTVKDLENLKLKENEAEIRAVGLGVVNFVSLSQFSDDGRACGVVTAKNFSSGNQGR